MSAILSFLGGTAFRTLFGEIAAFISKHQEHKHEMERLKYQSQYDADKHLRDIQMVEKQAAAGAKIIEVQRDADLDRISADAWREVVKATTIQTGIKLVDAWNAGIRPAGATIAIVMMIVEIGMVGWIIPDTTRDVFYAFLGLFVADRSLAKRGK